MHPIPITYFTSLNTRECLVNSFPKNGCQLGVGGASRVACLVGAMLTPKDGVIWCETEGTPPKFNMEPGNDGFQ